MEAHWRNILEELPKDGELCLVYGYLSSGIGHGIRYWNGGYNCFEEHRGGNFYQDDLEIKKWIPINEIDELPVHSKNNKVLLWLDDYRDPMSNDWLNFSPIGKDIEVVWVKDYNEFIGWINTNGLPDGICFDHDLGEGLNGYDCAKWLVEYCMEHNLGLPKWNIQSSNPVGRENINCLLNNFLKYNY